MDNNREEIIFTIANKLYDNLLETGKTIRHLFVYLFTLLFLVSAITYEPEIFGGIIGVTKDGITEYQKINLLGFSISIDSIVKYSSIVLSIIYLMLTTFLVYSEHLREQVIDAFTSLDSAFKTELKKLYFPSLNNIIDELSQNHQLIIIQIFYQLLNVVKSLLIYVLPFIIVITLLGEGLKRSHNVYLNLIFYFAPVVMFVCMLILTKEWYITIWKSLTKLYNFLIKIPEAISKKRKIFKLSPEIIKLFISFISTLIGVIISFISSSSSILDILKKLFE